MSEFELTHTNGIFIPHLSASTVNSFIESRHNFYQSKVKSKPFSGSEHTARGTAVEHGVNVWLENPDEKDILKHALDKYDDEIKRAGMSVIAGADFRETIKGLLDVALKFYQSEFGERKAITQHKFEYQLDGVNRKIVGYLDFLQFDHAVRDSKVSGKSPSKLKQAYVLQGALYRKALNLPVYFDFFVANKTPVHKAFVLTDDEYAFGISYLTAAAKCIEEIEECTCPTRMMELMSFPNLEAMWTTKDKKEAAEIWGITL